MTKSLPKRSTLLFGFDAKNGIPNGDPHTGEPRYDEETQRTLQSDVGIKRYIREYVLRMNAFNPDSKKHEIYMADVDLDALRELNIDIKNISGSAAQVKYLNTLYGNDPDILEITGGGKNGKKKVEERDLVKALILKCIDVRAFGGVATTKGSNVNLTGPIQLHMLNPSLHRVILSTMQNTTVFQSDTSKGTGSIGTMSIVPYAFFNVTGEVNPLIADETGLTEDEVLTIVKYMWLGVNTYRSRAKSNQTSRYAFKINYSESDIKIPDVDELIQLHDPDNTSYRTLSDLSFVVSRLVDLIKRDIVTNVEYMLDPALEEGFLKSLQPVSSKLVKINL